jgi:hypothetical protein
VAREWAGDDYVYKAMAVVNIFVCVCAGAQAVNVAEKKTL